MMREEIRETIKEFLSEMIECQQACKNDPLSALKNDPPGRGIK